MRILLVASQGSGVGTTTTAINLAAVAANAGQRVLFLDADPMRAGIKALGLSAEFAAGQPCPSGEGVACEYGFDVTTPYHAAADDDTSLASLLVALKTQARRHYDLIVIDAPSANRAPRLLHAANELLIVERADRASFRALPGFLESVRHARQTGATLGVRGILMTLAPGVAPGGPAELALRQKFKGLFPQAIPSDSSAVHQPIVCNAPTSLAAREYQTLAATLKLMPRSAPKRVLATVSQRHSFESDNEEVGIFHAPSDMNVETPLSGRTETFYPDRRPRAGKGPSLALPSASVKRNRLSPLEIAILASSAVVALSAAVWFCFG